MLIGISGPSGSGRHETVKFLEKNGFTLIDTQDRSSSEIVDSVTPRWRENFVILFDLQSAASASLLDAVSKRPFFVHVHIDAPVALRHERKHGSESLDAFVTSEQSALRQTLALTRSADVCIVNDTGSVENLWKELEKLNLLNQERMRPSWDTYFMRLADLAATRANCMKRRVGCVIVRDKRVIATGYNGTPRGLHNCNEGGCPRCNDGLGSGAGLGTCLCLHAEENALLEAGRDRVGTNGTLYCNTCPCLTCSIKIAQSGITEVVYSQAYSMDSDTATVLQQAGVKLRQFSGHLRK